MVAVVVSPIATATTTTATATTATVTNKRGSTYHSHHHVGGTNLHQRKRTTTTNSTRRRRGRHRMIVVVIIVSIIAMMMLMCLLLLTKVVMKNVTTTTTHIADDRSMTISTATTTTTITPTPQKITTKTGLKVPVTTSHEVNLNENKDQGRRDDDDDKTEQQQQQQQPSKSTTGTTVLKVISRFEPGSLSKERTDVVRSCYANSKESQIKPKTGGCAYSPKYKFLLYYIGKTGSSTQRNVMKDTFEAENKGQNQPCGRFTNRTVELHVTTTRDPVSRFMSGVKEMFMRRNVFTTEDNNQIDIPSQYRNFTKLLDGLSLEERRNVELATTPSNEQLKLQMFEKFIDDFDGRHSFDKHLDLQISYFVVDDGRQSKSMDIIMDSDTLADDLLALAQRVNATTQPDGRTKRRSSESEPRKTLNESMISDRTYQKICQLMAWDYCCLNYKLPPSCRRRRNDVHNVTTTDGIDSMVGKEDMVMCEWIEDTKTNQQMIRPVFV
jgi:Sulfotransferase family